MSRRITRRAAARLLMAGPAAFALPNLLPAEPVPAKSRARPALSTAERRQLEKSISQLRSTAQKVRKVAVPMGAEPAFVFRPILPKR
ncbi:MAG TPA: hypothetical protein VGQ75_10610 [Thermoanaerobaculia bacterium]|nr:hypothetical protein [Thermoanaerobaculia bacterium]HEV8608907.1 hypothetical protein [Thermoanaerobaculia bacterium]